MTLWEVQSGFSEDLSNRKCIREQGREEQGRQTVLALRAAQALSGEIPEPPT